MANIANYFEQAQLSLAAYALNLLPGMSGSDQDYVDKLKAAGMSQKQAEQFAAQYTVLSQRSDSNGFSATLFLDGTTGQKILAVRGTNDFKDLVITDLGIALFGLTNQYSNLEAYYQQLIAEGKLGANEVITLTGHSLGGLLVENFAIDYASVVGHAYTYNAPGFAGALVQLLEIFGATAVNVPLAHITNLQAQAGAELITGLGTVLGGVQPVFTEDQGFGVPGNHGLTPLTDSLALYQLFAQLDPALNTNPVAGMSKLSDILEAAAGTPGKSLENTLDALRTLFQQNYLSGTANGHANPTFADRDSFYTNLFSLQTYLKTTPFYNSTTQSLGFTVEKLTNVSSGTLVTNAQADIAYRYALYKLNPFVITNAGTLYNALNTGGSLNLYSSTTRTGALTDEYLKDRAAFLYNKIQANNKDNDLTADASTLATTWVQYSGNPQYFEDTSNYLPCKLYRGSNSSIVNQPTSGMNQIRFGSANIDTLTGGDLGDKLYGMDGADTLEGKKGNDYLEGGQSRAPQPERLRLVRGTAVAYRHRTNRYENKNQLKEAA